MSYGENIRNLREAQGLTQEALGNMIGVTKQRICQLERDERPLSVPMAKEIARMLGVKLSKITGE